MFYVVRLTRNNAPALCRRTVRLSVRASLVYSFCFFSVKNRHTGCSCFSLGKRSHFFPTFFLFLNYEPRRDIAYIRADRRPG